MSKRPLAITLVGFLFIAAGTIGIIYHAAELKKIGAEPEIIWVLVVRLLAIVGGVFVLRGYNWARWLLLVWITYHVILSFFHTASELIVHILFMTVVAYVLFRPKASAYFRER